MTYEEKLEGFPTVHYPSLIEFPERREFMTSQFEKYGIKKTKLLLTDRYEKIKHQYTLIDQEDLITHGHPGNIISYITLLKDWYDNSDEEYAIFCDDDMDFMSIDYWSFTWKEFISSLPKDWECIQLVRIQEWLKGHMMIYGQRQTPSLTIREQEWCDYGTALLVKKSYAKKILDRHYINNNTIETTVRGRPGEVRFFWPLIENVLFKNLGKVYNFPLFIEKCAFESFLKKQIGGKISDQTWNAKRYPHTRSREIYENMWKNYGLLSNLTEIMRLKN
jgi:hypothetical protein